MFMSSVKTSVCWRLVEVNRKERPGFRSHHLVRHCFLFFFLLTFCDEYSLRVHVTLLPQSLYLFVKNNTSQSCRATGGQAGLRGRLIGFICLLLNFTCYRVFIFYFVFIHIMCYKWKRALRGDRAYRIQRALSNLAEQKGSKTLQLLSLFRGCHVSYLLFKLFINVLWTVMTFFFSSSLNFGLWSQMFTFVKHQWKQKVFWALFGCLSETCIRANTLQKPFLKMKINWG